MKRTKRVVLFFVVSLVCGGFGALFSRAQTSADRPTSTVMGTLLDVNDARVVHAKIKIENPQFKWTGISDDVGDFSAKVPVGTYRIYVEANGFKKFESPFLNAKENVVELVNIHLEVAAIVDRITIPAKQP